MGCSESQDQGAAVPLTDADLASMSEEDAALRLEAARRAILAGTAGCPPPLT